MAFMPGAEPPSKAADDKSVSFEEPPKVQTLQSLTKVGVFRGRECGGERWWRGWEGVRYVGGGGGKLRGVGEGCVGGGGGG